SVPGLSCGTSHAVAVDAFDAAGNHSAAAQATVATAACADTTPPSPPSNLTGQTTATSLTAGWDAATDNVGVAGYDLYLNSAQDGTTQGTTYTITNLACGSSY